MERAAPDQVRAPPLQHHPGRLDQALKGHLRLQPLQHLIRDPGHHPTPRTQAPTAATQTGLTDNHVNRNI